MMVAFRRPNNQRPAMCASSQAWLCIIFSVTQLHAATTSKESHDNMVQGQGRGLSYFSPGGASISTFARSCADAPLAANVERAHGILQACAANRLAARLKLEYGVLDNNSEMLQLRSIVLSDRELRCAVEMEIVLQSALTYGQGASSDAFIAPRTMSAPPRSLNEAGTGNSLLSWLKSAERRPSGARPGTSPQFGAVGGSGAFEASPYSLPLEPGPAEAGAASAPSRAGGWPGRARRGGLSALRPSDESLLWRPLRKRAPPAADPLPASGAFGAPSTPPGLTQGPPPAPTAAHPQTHSTSTLSPEQVDGLQHPPAMQSPPSPPPKLSDWRLLLSSDQSLLSSLRRQSKLPPSPPPPLAALTPSLATAPPAPASVARDVPTAPSPPSRPREQEQLHSTASDSSVEPSTEARARPSPPPPMQDRLRSALSSDESLLSTLSKRKELSAQRAEMSPSPSLPPAAAASSSSPAPSGHRSDGAASRKNPEPPLPRGWRKAVDPRSGRAYYWNEQTQESTWDRP